MDDQHDRSLVLAWLLLLPGLGVVWFAALVPFQSMITLYPVGFRDLFRSLSDDPVLNHIFVFTLKQAALSSLFSGLFALVFGYYLYQKRVRPGMLLQGLGNLIFSLPPVVIAFAWILSLGNNGFVNRLLEFFDLHIHFLYNGQAVVLAHVYFNAIAGALWVRDQAMRIPKVLSNRARVSGFSWPMRFWFCEQPYLRPVLMRFMTLVFLMSLGSYAIPLTLGGGPASSTLELGVYEALRLEMNPEKAVKIALLQMLVSGISLLLYRAVCGDRQQSRLKFEGADPGRSLFAKGVSRSTILMIFFVIGVFGLPLIAVLIEGLSSFFRAESLSPGFCELLATGAFRTLSLSVASAFLAVLVAFCVSLGVWHAGPGGGFLVRLSEILIQLLPGFSPMVLSLGFYFSWKKQFPLWFQGPAPVVVVYACSALPWCWWKIHPAVMLVRENFRRQKAAINLRPLAGVIRVDLPALFPSLVQAFLIGLAPGISNLSVITLLAPEGYDTLASGMSDLMATYRFQEAAVFASALAALSLALVCLSGVLADRYERTFL